MAKKKTKAAKPRKQQKQPDERIEKLRTYVRTKGLSFLDDENITSIGVGYKITDGKPTDELCIQFTVASKPEGGDSPEALEALESLDTAMIPKSIEIDGEEIPTDVIQRKFELSHHLVAAEETNPRKLRVDPLRPGISVSHPSGTAGTLGMIVFDRQTGDPCILSNWHVLQTAAGQIDDGVVQPGPHDNNDVDSNRAGRLRRSHLGAAGDCAIARIEDRGFDRSVFELDVVPAQVGRVELGDTVVKSGRTTGVTRGVVRRTDVIAKLTYGGVGTRQIGCFEIGLEPGAPALSEVSMGGDSGSAWLIANGDGTASDVFAGLHFAGESSGNPDEHALACYAHSVLTKLDVSLEPVEAEELDVSVLAYDRDFLAERVRVPWLTDEQYDDAFKLDGSHLIPYAHFSVCLSRSRGFAYFVAWNIDGTRVWKLSRDGINFERDPRVDDELQHGNEIYHHNNLDRGHIARRADLTWGSKSEAERANRDSFHYTNIAPQHAQFNQSRLGGLWGELENAVLDEVRVEDLRISVLAGPIFSSQDQEYRGVRIPRAFWKLIAYTDSADGQFKVRAYMLTQQDLLSDIEVLDLDPFLLYQVPVSRLEQETAFSFRNLDSYDTFESGIEAEGVGPERVASARKIATRADLMV